MALTKVPNELSSTPSIVDGGNATAMTIDSSENVLVGVTSTTIPGIGNTTAGVSLRGDDGSFFSRALGSGDTNNVVSVNRSTADGNIFGFQKDGTTVGSIGTKSSLLTIGTGTTGLIFDAAQIYPWNTTTNAAIDASKDLGASGARFKDLYLSGGVNFSANANASGMSSETLSDYEEGTCTLTWSGSGGTANSTNTEFKYVKVGNLVSINGYTATNLPNATGTLELTGLPFAAVGAAAGSILYRNLTPPSGAHTLVCFLGNGSARFQPFWAATSTYIQLNSSHINSNNAQDMYLSINYRTS